MNDESQLALTRFDFTSGAHRGSQLTLYPRCLVHRSDAQLETLPLVRVAALKVSFKRDAMKLGWGIAFVVGALLLLALSAPLDSFAHGAAQEFIAKVLPVLAFAGVIGGAMLVVLGWRGSTTLTLSLGGGERAYSVRGRDKQLLDFAEIAAERLVAASRS